jgi:hypothetical protein
MDNDRYDRMETHAMIQQDGEEVGLLMSVRIGQVILTWLLAPIRKVTPHSF